MVKSHSICVKASIGTQCFIENPCWKCTLGANLNVGSRNSCRFEPS